VSLDNAHSSQLYRYFSVTEARFAILTNGTEYRFFTDLERPNTMDTKPFLVFDIAKPDETLLPELQKFTKSAFDEDAIVEVATALKYVGELRRYIAKQWREPSDEYVRFLAAHVYEGRLTAAVVQQFASLIRQAHQTFLSDQISDRLRSAMQPAPKAPDPVKEDPAEGEAIETTEDEREAFHIIRAILREFVQASRIVMRDAKSYCAILLDDNNRKAICRLHFNTNQKYIGTFDEEKKETRQPIGSVDEIYDLRELLIATVSRLAGVGSSADDASAPERGSSPAPGTDTGVG
jgi:hypothetical protein